MTGVLDLDTMEPLDYPFALLAGLRPNPRYAELQNVGVPVRVRLPYGGVAWLITRYPDVRAVLADPRFSRAHAAGRDTPRARAPQDAPEQLLSMDPPRHTRLRRLVATAFTARRVEDLRPRARAIVISLLEAMRTAPRPTDLSKALAWPLPVTIISELLGVPTRDRYQLGAWTELTLMVGQDTALTTMHTAREHLNAYLAGLIDDRRRQPREDLLSALVAARDEGDRLSEEELVRLAVTLLISGHETTASQIGNFLFVLLERRERWRRLVERPDVVPRAVEELLRCVPVSSSADFARIALEDVEVGGRRITAGDAVLVKMDAANRDAAVFPHPDDLDLDRDPNPHLAFGHGVHHCLGAPLARLELQVVLDLLARQMPTLRLAVPANHVPWRTDTLVRRVQALPVTW